jgi:hypothetical protein
MWKTVVAGVTVLAIAGGSLVYAQQRSDAAQAPRWHRHMSAQDLDAFADARIAALKAGLKLTPEQEKNWPALEKALREQAKARSERFTARASADRPRDPVERLRLRAEAMTQTGTALKQVAEAAAPLYQSLDDAQKHRFMVLAQLDRPRFGSHHRWHHRDTGRGMMRGHMNGYGPAGTGDDNTAPKPQ